MMVMRLVREEFQNWSGFRKIMLEESGRRLFLNDGLLSKTALKIRETGKSLFILKFIA